MKFTKQMFKVLFLIAFLIITVNCIHGQANDPGAYISRITETQQNTSAKYLAYASAGSHGKRLKKVEKLRIELMNSILDARMKAKGMPPYEGDKTLKDAAYDYFLISYNVMKEDYGKLVDMEEVAEQSYDQMEAYLLAKQMAEKKMQDAGTGLQQKVKDFAERNNVKLVESKDDEIEIKLKESNELMDYYNEVYLIFFKSYKQDLYLTDAVNAGNINAIEQNRSALESFSDEGLEKLKNLAPFKNDGSILMSCRNTLTFYKNEAKNNTPAISDYFMKLETFNEKKKLMESKPASKRTKEDIDNYNKAVKDMNAAGENYNRINKNINDERTKLLDNWNKVVDKFFDNYMPHFKQ